MNEWDTLIPLVSAARLQPYLNAANQNKEEALELYKLNIKLSETLYPFLSIFEVTLRNRIAAVLIAKYGGNWFNGNGGSWVDERGTSMTSYNDELDQLNKTKEKLNTQRKNLVLDNIIAELNLGFWTGMLKDSYQKTIWHHHIADLFPDVNPKNYNLKRNIKKIRGQADNIRRCRNRVFHHDPLFVGSYSFQNLLTNYLEGYQLISWLSQDIFRLLTSQDIFLKTVVKIPRNHWEFIMPRSSSNSQLIISKIVDFQENI
ncbi:Abi family protein [Phormidium pseudopriestleyi FRX01]|uniref:Abi family protein n=1 Tax=Phormidium pseudopriestleyi FRX01 TaxID=1759528 RepID=A0ABS3FW07_9CYAN|nr:Abi family protein [Phormidium pseudopriestleyi]MBO0351299.1 Abi family protein [Phormidium pseudopriestleyi FRX01]